MLRFTLIPFILLFGGLFFSVFCYVIYRKIKKGIKYTYDKSAEISSQYQEKWKQKEQRQRFPTIVQTGYNDFEAAEAAIAKLPAEWKSRLIPLRDKSREILSELGAQLEEDEHFEHSKLSSYRSFFKHSLDALKQMSQKLVTDHASLSGADSLRAEENIDLIYADLKHHEALLHKKRKFDFDVLMDVIKARVKR